MSLNKKRCAAMDTMVMGVRVAMLMLATSLFALIWSNDTPEEMLPTIRPNQSPYEQQDLAAARVAGQIPVPQGIQPGTYLVVDQSGRTETKVITNAGFVHVSNNRSTSTNPHYQVNVGNRRWHYVRIDQPLNEQAQGMSQAIH